MLALQLGKILYAVKHIGIKAHLVFKTLRRCVRQPCECAEICRIYEIFISKSADVNAVFPAGNDLLRSFHRVAAYAVELGKIVGASRRHIADGDIQTRFYQSGGYHAGYRLVYRTVAARAADHVIVPAVCLDVLCRVAAAARRIKAHAVACVHEYARDLGQMAHHLALSGNGVYYEHHVFLCARHAARRLCHRLRHRVRTLGVKAAVLLAHGVVNRLYRIEREIVFPSAHHLHRVYGAA